jgi:hypothetical protein
MIFEARPKWLPKAVEPTAQPQKVSPTSRPKLACPCGVLRTALSAACREELIAGNVITLADAPRVASRSLDP